MNRPFTNDMQMANKHIKDENTWERVIKTKMKYHYRPTDLFFENLTIVSVGEDMDKLNSLCNAHENVKCYIHFGKVWQFLDELHIYLRTPQHFHCSVFTQEKRSHTNTCM